MLQFHLYITTEIKSMYLVVKVGPIHNCFCENKAYKNIVVRVYHWLAELLEPGTAQYLEYY